MSDQTPETTTDDQASEQVSEAPVRVPNVSPHAVSGLDHEPIGSNAGEAYAANQALADEQHDTDDKESTSQPSGDVTVPDDTDAEGLLAWITAGDDDQAKIDRQEAVEDAEFAKDEPDADLLGALGWEPAGEDDPEGSLWRRVSEDGDGVEYVSAPDTGDSEAGQE